MARRPQKLLLLGMVLCCAPGPASSRDGTAEVLSIDLFKDLVRTADKGRIVDLLVVGGAESTAHGGIAPRGTAEAARPRSNGLRLRVLRLLLLGSGALLVLFGEAEWSGQPPS